MNSARTPAQPAPDGWWIFHDGAVLLGPDGEPFGVARDWGGVGEGDADAYAGPACHAARLLERGATRPEPPEGCRWEHVRGLVAAGAASARAVLAALGFLNWKREHRLCGRCGAPLAADSREPALRCGACGHLFYPAMSDAVIVRLLRDDGAILLARHRQRNQTVWACIAGYVNLGEHPEAAVHREVREETGFEVDGVRFLGMEYWPFPNSLMFAYEARVCGGTLRIQEEELLEAAWFSPDALPATPGPGSIAYRLVHFLI